MILIKNGRVIDPESGLDEVLDIVIEENKVKNIGKFHESDEYEEIIDAKGYIVAPGLVDTHVHFREPGFEYKEDIASGARAAAKGGFTSVVCMANTNPIVDNAETLQYVLDKAKEAVIHVHTCAAITKGFGGKQLTDMLELKKQGAIGFTDDGIPLMGSKVLYDAMEMAKELNVPISLHEEDAALIEMYGVNKGEVSKRIGIGGAPAVAESAMIARDVMLAVDTGAKVNVQHISSGQGVALVKFAQEQGADVVAEATPQHFSATEELVIEKGALAKVNPPLRTEADRMKIIGGLKDGTIGIIATDHAPHSKEEKAKPIEQAPSGMIGLETALALGITNLVQKGHLSMDALLEKMTRNPAKLYDLDVGYVKEGGPADIVIFDEHEEWTVGEEFASKSSNSPFIGQSVFGKIKFTICNGKVVYSDK